MLSLVLIGTALAQSPVPDLHKQVSAETPPVAAISCAPVSDVFDIFRVVLSDDELRSDLGEQERQILPLLEPGGLEAAGIDPDGGILLASGDGDDTKANRFLSLGFKGDAAQAEKLIQNLQESAITPGDTPGTWTLTDDGQTIQIELIDGAIVAKSAASNPTGAKGHTDVLKGLPDTAGCALYIDAQAMDKKNGKLARLPIKIYGLSIFVPTRGGTAHARILTDIELKTDFSGAALTQTYGSSIQRPTAVLIITADPTELIMEVIDKLPPLPPLQPLKAALQNPEKSPIKIPPGSTVAMFEAAAEKLFVLAVPVQTRRGRPVPARRLGKGVIEVLNGLKIPFEQVSKTQFKVGGGGKESPGFITLHRGIVYVGTDEALVAQAANGQGTPWVSEELRALAAHTGLAGEAHTPPTQDLPASNLRMGVALADGLIDFQFQADFPGMEHKTLADLISTFERAGMTDRFKNGIMSGSPTHKMKRNLEGIAMAQLGYNTEFESFVEAGPWPREVEELDKNEVSWAPSESQVSKDKNPHLGLIGFQRVGWGPDEATTLGTYWVELSDDGKSFTAWGAIDEDGDGVPALFKVSMSEGEGNPSAVRTTPEGVR